MSAADSESASLTSSSSTTSSTSEFPPLLQQLSSTAADSAGSLEELSKLLNKLLSQSDFLTSSILSYPLQAAIDSGNEAAARRILSHNASHISQYSKSDCLYASSPTDFTSHASREVQLTFAMEAALRKGMYGLLASIREAGLETVDSSFAYAIAAPTESDRFLSLSTAVNLWGLPSGEAFGDLIETVLPADAPQCLEFILQQQALQDGAEMEPAYAELFIQRNTLSDTNRQLLQRIKDGH